MSVMHYGPSDLTRLIAQIDGLGRPKPRVIGSVISKLRGGLWGSMGGNSRKWGAFLDQAERLFLEWLERPARVVEDPCTAVRERWGVL